MYGAQRAMRRAGYATLNLTYPSLRFDLSGLAAFVHKKLLAAQVWKNYARVHFVTHSMGGLVARHYLEEYRGDIPPAKMGRLVMIAPPNGGSEVADFLKNFPPYRWGFGPAGQQLTTQARAADQPVPWYDVGVIAGNRAGRTVDPPLIPGVHDGMVAVEKTKMAGMKDHKVVNATHSLIVWRPSVQQMAIGFLKTGKFN
jgi:triacylglycerol lipase